MVRVRSKVFISSVVDRQSWVVGQDPGVFGGFSLRPLRLKAFDRKDREANAKVRKVKYQVTRLL
jgi:hypothetical protein